MARPKLERAVFQTVRFFCVGRIVVFLCGERLLAR